MTTISISELKNLCKRAMINGGMSPSHAKIATEHYLENEMSGKHSHGMVRVVEAAKIYTKFGGTHEAPSIERDKGNMITFNAQRCLGAVAGYVAMNTAIERTHEHGLTLVGIRNYIGNSGAMAYYLRRLVKAGLVVIMGTNSVAMVAPPNGRQRRLGTNPLGIGIPGEQGKHVIADFGTSHTVYGKMLVARDKGEPMPEGALIDKSGMPSTQFDDAYDGAMLPFAEYKGFSLGLMIELLAGPLINANAVKQDLYDNDGLFIISISPQSMGHDNFKSNIYNALKKITDTPLRPDHDAITLPGERSQKHLNLTLERGTLNVTEQTLNTLKTLAK